MAEIKSTRIAYGEALAKLGAVDDKVLVCDADLAHATMTAFFADKYPDRFYNFGIAECNMMDASAGLAHCGYTVFASTFAIFGAGHAFEQVRNAICYTNANVKLGLSHAGPSCGEDGGSHQAVEDIALMRTLPRMTVIAPCDAVEMEKAVFAAAKTYGPMFIRTGRLPTEVRQGRHPARGQGRRDHRLRHHGRAGHARRRDARCRGHRVPRDQHAHHQAPGQRGRPRRRA